MFQLKSFNYLSVSVLEFFFCSIWKNEHNFAMELTISIIALLHGSIGKNLSELAMSYALLPVADEHLILRLDKYSFAISLALWVQFSLVDLSFIVLRPGSKGSITGSCIVSRSWTKNWLA